LLGIVQSLWEDFHCFNRKQGTNSLHILLMQLLNQ
jgi:hypothetical protein